MAVLDPQTKDALLDVARQLTKPQLEAVLSYARHLLDTPAPTRTPPPGTPGTVILAHQGFDMSDEDADDMIRAIEEASQIDYEGWEFPLDESDE